MRLRWRKRRWYSPSAACPRKSFTEQVTHVPARSRLTRRLRQAADAAVADGGRTIVQAARDHGVSWPVAAAAFTTHATAVLPAEPEPVTVLGIDEVRRGKPHWNWDEATGSWTVTADRRHVGFVDLSGGQGLLAQIDGRTTAAVTGWLTARPPGWRVQVRAVAIDMCTLAQRGRRGRGTDPEWRRRNRLTRSAAHMSGKQSPGWSTRSRRCLPRSAPRS